jgi:hypothetical protein
LADVVAFLVMTTGVVIALFALLAVGVQASNNDDAVAELA